MPEVLAPDAIRLHVDVDGRGDPVTVFAHGLTNSLHGARGLHAVRARDEGALLLPRTRSFAGRPGRALPVRRLRGRPATPSPTRTVRRGPSGRRSAPARSPGCSPRTRIGSNGSSSSCRRRSISRWSVTPCRCGPRSCSRPSRRTRRSPRRSSESGREAAYARAPGLREFDLLLWQDLDPVGVARAIRGVIGERRDRGPRAVAEASPHPPSSSAAVVTRSIPVEVGRVIAELLPNAELIELGSEQELFDAIPMLVDRVARFLA